MSDKNEETTLDDPEIETLLQKFPTDEQLGLRSTILSNRLKTTSRKDGFNLQ
jgi:hypothetical protein